jgi:hypothetical protein
MHEVRWMLAQQCQACETGADAAARVLKPRVLCPVTTVTYRRDTGSRVNPLSPCRKHMSPDKMHD